MIDAGLQSGRAKTVLVFGEGDAATACLSTVVVSARAERGKQRLTVTGPVSFGDKAEAHIKEVVAAVANSILGSLGLRGCRYELSVSNLGATAAADIGIEVGGFSADVAILLGMLSAALALPISANVVATGHIASPDGEIAPVRDLPAKLAVAIRDDSIEDFIFPILDKDGSLASLSPVALSQTSDAVAAAKQHLRIIPVSDVAELLEAVVDDETAVLTSLQQGYFGNLVPAGADASPIGRCAQNLLSDLEERFWISLEQQLLAGASEDAGKLLLARARHHVRNLSYPRGIGRRLSSTIAALPPATRRVKLRFPLLPTRVCIELSQQCADVDLEDVRHLFDAAVGRVSERSSSNETAREPQSSADDGVDDTALDTVVSKINAESLAREIANPIDRARGAYQLDSVTTDSYDDFNDVVSAFYLHLIRHTHQVLGNPDPAAVSAEAMELVDTAFVRSGGLDGAVAEARDGTRGGLRYVLDVLTDQFKRDRQANYMRFVLNSTLDPLDWDARVSFMAALLQRLDSSLPDDIKKQPPERYAKHGDELIHAYVQSMDQVRHIFRAY